jgi:hypothetical protein
MAATDTFDMVLSQLSQEDKGRVKDFIKEQRSMILASRSEDARMRIAHQFSKEVHELLLKK